MAYANAATYAPDDAARDLNDRMIIDQQGLYAVAPQHSAGSFVSSPVPVWVPFAALAVFIFWWANRG